MTLLAVIAADRVVAFFRDHLPPLADWLRLGPPLALWAAACLAFAGWLKLRRGWRTGYTRKTFHFLTFATATALQVQLGLTAVCLFGAVTSLVVGYAVMRGDGHLMYEAIAREKDAPHRTWYIVMPYVATLLGGVISNVFFARTAVIGYLVCGIGDAAGEPVGTRFGRHRYRVLLPGRVPCERSLEGSLGVAVASTLAALIAALSIPGIDLSPMLLGRVVLLGITAALLEAVSPHGFDNAVMMIVPSAIGV